MIEETGYLKVKFALGVLSLVVGFIGASIALFQWVERTGIQYLLGNYARYVLGFGGFAAMIFGAMLANDAWVLGNVMKGKYWLLTNYAAANPKSQYEEAILPSKVYDGFQIPSSLPEYKKRIIKKILKGWS